MRPAGVASISNRSEQQVDAGSLGDRVDRVVDARLAPSAVDQRGDQPTPDAPAVRTPGATSTPSSTISRSVVRIPPRLQVRAPLMGPQLTDRRPSGSSATNRQQVAGRSLLDHPPQLRGPPDLRRPTAACPGSAGSARTVGRWQRERPYRSGGNRVPLRPPGTGPVPRLVDRPDVQVSRVRRPAASRMSSCGHRRGVAAPIRRTTDGSGRPTASVPPAAWTSRSTVRNRGSSARPDSIRAKRRLSAPRTSRPTPADSDRPADAAHGAPARASAPPASSVWSLASVTGRCSRLVSRAINTLRRACG